jgi:hypothetical protein
MRMMASIINPARMTPSGRIKPVTSPLRAKARESHQRGVSSFIRSKPKDQVEAAARAKNGVPK